METVPGTLKISMTVPRVWDVGCACNCSVDCDDGENIMERDEMAQR